MARTAFFEVFPTLKVNSELKDLFSEVDVVRLTSNHAHDLIKVYIESKKIIREEDVLKVKNELERYLNVGKRIHVEIVEKYNLSAQYNPKYIMEDYRESIILELDKKSKLISTMFKKADITYDKDGSIYINLENNMVSESKIDLIKKTLEDIFENRFGMPTKVHVLTEKKNEKDFKKQNEKRLQNELKALRVTAGGSGRFKEEQIGEKNETEGSDKKGSGAVNKNQKNSKEISRPLKKTGADILYGKELKPGVDTNLCDIDEEVGNVTVKGLVMDFDERKLKSGKHVVTLSITDFTDSITVKIFLEDDRASEEFFDKLGEDAYVRVQGSATYDTYDKEVEILRVYGIKIIPKFSLGHRDDTAIEKRVELHCHTKMSEMDGVSECGKIVRRAYEWGHKAIAITDHGVVQAFPEAWHEYCNIKKECKKSKKDLDFKVIYGLEAYLVDDLKDVITNPKGQSLDGKYVVFDIETTGFSAKNDNIIEIGAVKVENGEITDHLSTFVNPKRPIPYNIEKLTSISDDMVMNAPVIEDILPEFMKFCEGAVMVAHNADFDMGFIAENCRRQNISCDFSVVDTVALSHYLLPGLSRYRLDSVAKALGISLEHHHRAVDDAESTALIFIDLCGKLRKLELYDLDSVNKAAKASKDAVSKLPAHHAVILVKNLTGLKNIYRLVSISHIETFSNKHPRILKSDYQKYSEGLMIGSACVEGEIYQAFLRGQSKQEIARLAKFYDYFEVQPIGNNEFMVKTGDEEIDSRKRFLVDSKDELKDINRQIINLGKSYGKMTVATGDVHFLDSKDGLYRSIIQYGNGYRDADNQPPLYLKTTDEMLSDFDYIDGDVAREIVITNPNRICDMIENISPINPDKCPPHLDNSEEDLRKSCFEKAHEVYGEKLPKIVEQRLETELNSIIGNGYAVMYIMAKRLVEKSNKEGYLVGSRGSVGSSFAANMAGITECNPLEPHYYCLNCKSSFFQDEYSASAPVDEKKVKNLSEAIRMERECGGVGFDLPSNTCPCCGEKLKKDGLEIPFETFLGFDGTKEPDIDLNFSGEYQPVAHAYTEEMFGKDYTFRAGTITKIADKTAYGYIKTYFDDHGMVKREAEIKRMQIEFMGIKRSTGQHPGGLVILPRDKEIYDFTPVQKPANDMKSDVITTHFEYHSIDENLLKLDLLGHDDPTMIRRMENLTGTDVHKDVPFDDEKVMSLFLSPKALGITPEDIDGCPTGSLGLPELGTDFVIQMLVDTKPQKFADLLRIAGLSHGTDVWIGNAQKLIKEGTCTISTAVCTRDDIMVYLMGKGIEPQVSFQMMEHVRKKNKGLCVYTDKNGNEIDEKAVMREHGVPEWYIWSCDRIKYMFPKAHAAAYVMMALRVAWYKVYHPLAYYAAYFAIRAKAFDYEIMCQGAEKLNYHMVAIKRKKENREATEKEVAMLEDMKLVKEMYARGFEFIPIDIYRAKAHEFQIIDGKLMPAFHTIEGLGEKAADTLALAVEKKHGPFVSKNELKDKAKLSKTVIDTMSRLGLLGDMPEDSQLSIFDM